MNSAVAIKFSLGLLIMLVLQAIFLAISIVLLHPTVGSRANDSVVSAPEIKPKPKYEPAVGGDTGYPVNPNARDEVKYGGLFNRQPAYCPTCPQQPQYVQPSYVQPSYIQPQYVQPARPVQPVVQPTRPVQPSMPAAPREPSRIVTTDKPIQSSARYEISLFLGNDPRSQALASWFKTDPTLVEWRNACSYQEYTPSNQLYQTMKTRSGVALKDVVPVDQFPAIVVSNPDGGHIHAAGGNMLPDSPQQLAADIRAANELAKQVTRTNSGLLRTAGYSWDSVINPAMRLEYNPNCPDGKCPTGPNGEDPSRWTPGRLVNNLFDRGVEKSGMVKDALYGWLEIIVGGVAVMFLGFMVCVVFGLLIWKLSK